MQKNKMEELSYKDLSNNELDTLKDMYISSRVNSMTESDLRKFVMEIIIDQIKGTVGNAEAVSYTHLTLPTILRV